MLRYRERVQEGLTAGESIVIGVTGMAMFGFGVAAIVQNLVWLGAISVFCWFLLQERTKQFEANCEARVLHNENYSQQFHPENIMSRELRGSKAEKQIQISVEQWLHGDLQSRHLKAKINEIIDEALW